jgi:hypothetical protein
MIPALASADSAGFSILQLSHHIAETRRVIAPAFRLSFCSPGAEIGFVRHRCLNRLLEALDSPLPACLFLTAETP